MAILEDGPNGGFRGKVGSVYGYKLNGEWVIRGVRTPSTKPPTAAQLLHREKMKINGEFCQRIKPILTFGYQFEAAKDLRRGAFQLGQKHVINSVIELDAASKPYLNMEKLQVFVGELMPPTGIEVRLENDILKLSWIPNPKYYDSIYKLNLALINPNKHMDFKMGVADAAQGECSIEIPVFKREKFDYHVYIGFWDMYKGTLSNSVYCGII
ncbi:MAG: hypothetical protein K0R59_3155 [Sphingobacterium sp.]|jgi:hypothetical protein|uniref:hypothetical protein n=1 Tax=Sphingobacterium sp. CZ-UAM TaxID=1933868 RepID=UPI0009855A52|nr:hypothetical protein [Sphingobacterium sp. CZ-UAM]MDF2517859.1 hypothetical protein [Sphingobacterium sp.]OOG17367.1 hypothetical protein BWD42_14250 [Sphingobacterium sp. CZ-UAM]